MFESEPGVQMVCNDKVVATQSFDTQLKQIITFLKSNHLQNPLMFLIVC